MGDFPFLIFLIDAGSGNPCDYSILDYDLADPCDTAITSFAIDPGIYDLWAGPSVFSGVSCSAEYVAWLTFDPQCVVNCPLGGIPEGEPDCGPDYVDNFNGGL